MRVVISIFLALLVVLPLASATSSYILTAAEDQSNHIYFDQTATFELKITNNDDTAGVYTWSVSPVEWVIDSKNSVRVEPGKKVTVPIEIRPRPSNFRGPGFYLLPLRIESTNADEAVIQQLSITILNPDPSYAGYKPSVALGAFISESVDPRDLVTVRVELRNRNILDMEGLELIIDGGVFDKKETFDLIGLEEKTLEYRFDIDPLMTPQEKEMHVKIWYKNRTLSEVKKFYDIKEYSTIQRDIQESSTTFTFQKVTSLANNGNIPKTVVLNLDVPFWKKPFVSNDVVASQVDIQDGDYHIVLQPQENATVTITEDYTVLPITALIIIVLIVLYYSMRSPITLQKQIIVTGRDDEGISEMKVRIYLKNRTGNAYYNVRLLDKAPSIANVDAAGGLGVLEPTKIVHSEKKGTIVKWDFDSLEAYEERIVTYKIKARLKIIGNFGLPSVKVKFENAKGSQRTTQSSKAMIGTKSKKGV